MTTISWLVPDLIDGSGGHRTILQHAQHLQSAGFAVRILLERDCTKGLVETPAQAVKRRFGFELHDVRVGWESIDRCDMLVATAWHSASHVKKAPFECHRVYFVQDLESLFAPAGYLQLIAENSYKYGLVPITIGNWLRNELFRHFGISSLSFDFCADRQVYRPLDKVQRENAVCFVHQPEKPRRASNLGLDALSIVQRERPATKIYTYGSTKRPAAAFPHHDLALLDLEQCNYLYNRCRVGLCISASNPSRIPFEMMAAGLPVVELYRDNTRFDLPSTACLLADQTPESMAKAIVTLLDDPSCCSQMGAAGRQHMQDRDISRGLEQFLVAIRWILAGPIGAKPPRDVPVPVYQRKSVLAEERNVGTTPTTWRTVIRKKWHRGLSVDALRLAARRLAAGHASKKVDGK